MVVCTDRAGFITLDRVLQDSLFMQPGNEYLLKIWVQFIYWAFWRNGTDCSFGGQQCKLKRGEFQASTREIAAALGWTRGKTVRAIKRLKTEQRIDQRTDHQSSIISIINYDIYQKVRSNDEQRTEQRTDKRATNERQTTSTTVGRSYIEEQRNKGTNIIPPTPSLNNRQSVDNSKPQGGRERWNAKLSPDNPERTELAQKWFDHFTASITWVVPYNATPLEFEYQIALIEKECGLTTDRVAALFDFMLTDPFWCSQIKQPEDLLTYGMGSKLRKIDNVLRKMNATKPVEKLDPFEEVRRRIMEEGN